MSSDFTAPVLSTESITDGIDISTWTVKSDSANIQFSVWDFAGQTVYYNTHQFFLSGRSVYLLVWNTRLGYEHSGLDFWLNSIACHCPKAPIFIVGTHADQVTRADIPTDDIREKHPNIAGFFNVSSIAGRGIKELLQALTTKTLNLPYMGEMIPESWLALERKLLGSRNTSSLLTWKSAENMANQAGIYGEEVKQAIRFLDDLGSIQHFDNDQLKDQVVINPQWIVDVMACVISVNNKFITDGRLRHDQISAVWRQYPTNLHEWMLRLTEVFDLTFPLPNKHVSIVPCLLPTHHPKFSWPKLDEDEELKESKLIYTFEYLPAGLFNRAQVRLHQFSDMSTIWKTGSLIRKNDHMGLLLQASSREISVKVIGPEPGNMVLLIHEVFEDLISEFFQGVHYEYQIPCPDCVSHRTDDPTMFSSKVLRRAVELKALFLQCHTFFHTLSMDEVQCIMPPQSSRDYLLQIETAVRGLDELEGRMGTDLFLLYCDKDFWESGSEVVHIKRIHEDLVKEGFNCWFSEDLGSLSLDKVAVAMKVCRLVLVFVSDCFAQDQNCERLFQFAKDTLRKDIQLVMVGQGREWMQSDFIGIQTTEHVFINFQRLHQYQERFEELIVRLKHKLQKGGAGGDSANTQTFDVFLSYAWNNSAIAVEKGHARSKDGAVGLGDPRKIKEFLEAQGMTVWMDIEQVGRMGLYEDISSGMKRSKVVVACVSDEYTMSNNCQIEFRFAHTSLKKPIILTVVGTGDLWESTEIGMLSLGYPKVNFQVDKHLNYEHFLDYVTESLIVADEPDVERPLTANNRNTKEQAFQELYELAQRKFLRQVASYSSVTDPFPRLFVLDLTETVSEGPEVIIDADEAEVTDKLRDEDMIGEEIFTQFMMPGMFCAKVLCEHEGGWHTTEVSYPLDIEGKDLALLWQAGSGYLAQVLTILKHSNINLNIVRTTEGQRIISVLEKIITQSTQMNIKPFHTALKNYIISKDVKGLKGGLKRCYMPSGKHLWLCPEHQNLPRVTVLDDVELEAEEDITEMVASLFTEELTRVVENKTTVSHGAERVRSARAMLQKRPSKLGAKAKHMKLLRKATSEDREALSVTPETSLEVPTSSLQVLTTLPVAEELQNEETSKRKYKKEASNRERQEAKLPAEPRVARRRNQPLSVETSGNQDVAKTADERGNDSVTPSDASKSETDSRRLQRAQTKATLKTAILAGATVQSGTVARGEASQACCIL